MDDGTAMNILVATAQARMRQLEAQSQAIAQEHQALEMALKRIEEPIQKDDENEPDET